jgi:hypothetical protein
MTDNETETPATRPTAVGFNFSDLSKAQLKQAIIHLEESRMRGLQVRAGYIEGLCEELQKRTKK